MADSRAARSPGPITVPARGGTAPLDGGAVQWGVIRPEPLRRTTGRAWPEPGRLDRSNHLTYSERRGRVSGPGS